MHREAVSIKVPDHLDVEGSLRTAVGLLENDRRNNGVSNNLNMTSSPFIDNSMEQAEIDVQKIDFKVFKDYCNLPKEDPGDEDPEDNPDILDSPTHIHAVGDAFVFDGFTEDKVLEHGDTKPEKEKHSLRQKLLGSNLPHPKVEEDSEDKDMEDVV